MFNKRKESLAREKLIEDLTKDNQSLGKENQDLKLDLHEQYTKNIKLNTVLEKLIIAICYSEDEKLLRTCDKILKDLGE